MGGRLYSGMGTGVTLYLLVGTQCDNISLLAQGLTFFSFFPAPFVIIELSNQEEILFVKNTKQKSNKMNPLFEQTFDIPVSTDSKVPLEDFHLQITVLRYTFSGSNDVVGLIRLETGSTYENEADHWKEVTLNPHTTVTKWHKLRIA